MITQKWDFRPKNCPSKGIVEKNEFCPGISDAIKRRNIALLANNVLELVPSVDGECNCNVSDK